MKVRVLNTLLLPRFYLLLCILLVLIPLAVIVSALNEFDAEIWSFLLEFQLAILVKNTLILGLGVGLGVMFLGTSTAWLTTMYDFPLRKWFFWALMLPLAMPAYVLAFSWLGIFDYSGAISTWLREEQGWAEGLPAINHAGGLIVVMSLAFYPYVYLLARNAFSSMGQRALEAGASLGLSPTKAFFKIALPMARPWIIGGAILALMETLADFGTVSIFVYETFTTAIYEAWFGFFSLETAKQLASLLIFAVFILLALEQLSRGHRRFHSPSRTHHHQRKGLTSWQKWGAFAYCFFVLLLGFLVPLGQLLWWISEVWQESLNMSLGKQVYHSLLGALLAAVVAAAVALLLALSKRAERTSFSAIAARIATLGYAIPNTVLAVGVFVPIAWFDNYLISWFAFSEDTTAILKGTLLVLILAYLVRFLAVAYAPVEAGLERISTSQIEAARSLGSTSWNVLKRVYLPLLKGSVGTAMLMTFVDIMKEMPITLMMRPYDWDTLAVKIYSFTAEGQYAEAALPALLIVLTGLIPVIMFSKTEQAS